MTTETRRFQAHAAGVRSCYADTPRGAADLPYAITGA